MRRDTTMKAPTGFPTPETERVLDQTAKLFRDGAPPVYLLPDGRFAARQGDVWLVRATMKTLDRLLLNGRPSLAVFVRGDYKPVEAVELTRGRMIDAAGKKHHGSSYWRRWYVYDAALAARLEDLDRRMAAAKKAFEEEEAEIEDGLQDVTEDNFKDLLNAAKGKAVKP